MTEDEALSRLLTSKNYRDLCPDTVRREFIRQLDRHKNAAQAEKAARERLHALSGAFMSLRDLKTAQKYLIEYQNGDTDALLRALRLHASTRERMDSFEALFARVLAATGPVHSVFDAACGINPLALGRLGFQNVLGWDVSGGAVQLINDWAGAAGWSVSAACRDVTLNAPEGSFDLALMMKLLPVLETDAPGSALQLMQAVNARYYLVTFPTRSLSGRSVGMEKNYSQWFEQLMQGRFSPLDRFVIGSELAYVVEREPETKVVESNV